MTGTSCIGWDIGGAHLKMARIDAGGALVEAGQYATPLWRGMDTLSHVLVDWQVPDPANPAWHAVTMTGELVDYFPDRQSGVRGLLDCFLAHIPDSRTRVYAGTEGFVPVAQSQARWARIASANWAATANWVSRRVDCGVLLDIGSTTTDVVPFTSAGPCNRGHTDRERLQAGELVYTGVVRTPLMALARRVPVRGRWQNTAAEYFATMADVYRLTGELPPGADLHETADLRGKSEAESVARLARMVGAEPGDEAMPVWRRLAEHYAAVQERQIAQALDKVARQLPQAAPVTLVAAGVGSFIAARLASQRDWRLVQFADLLPGCQVQPGLAGTCAPAVAIAALLQEQLRG